MSSSYERAIEAGYSPEEVVDFFSQKDPKFKEKYQKGIEAGYSPEEIFSFAEKKKQPSRARSIVSAPVKGFAKEALDILQASPVKGPIPFKGQQAIVEKLLPTQDRPLEKGLERAGKLAPLAATGGEGLLAKGIRTGVGALAGQTAEELGAPEYIQSLAELASFMAPKISGKLQPTKSQKEAVEFLRSKGLTDKEITPLIQSEKTSERLQEVHEKLGQGYEELKTEAKSKNLSLPKEKMTSFFDNFDKTLQNISPRFRRLLKEDIGDFENSRMGFNDFVDFWQDINGTVKGQTGGRAVLNRLKEPLQKGLQDIDPALAKDFNKLNEFYSKKAKVAKLLSPKQLDDLFEAGKVYGAIGAIANGNMGFIKNIFGAVAGRGLVREMLTNPRLQNLSNQMLKALSQNKLQNAKKIYDVFKKEYGKLPAEKPNNKENSNKSS